LCWAASASAASLVDVEDGPVDHRAHARTAVAALGHGDAAGREEGACHDWIADFAPSYAVLADPDWSAEEERADAVVDLEAPEEVPPGWDEPVPATVVASRRGAVAVGSELPLRLAPGGDQPFNGMHIHVLPRERWRTCAQLLADGSALPGDGTRRVEAATPVAAAA